MNASIYRSDGELLVNYVSTANVPDTGVEGSGDNMHDYYGRIDTDTGTWVQFFSEANYGGVSYLVQQSSSLTSLQAVFDYKVGSFKVLDSAPTSDGSSWEEEYAYTLGVQAYIWGFPWIYSDYLRWLWTSPEGQVLASKSGQSLPHMAMNSFFSAKLATSGGTSGGSPNCDTLYSIAWLDLSEPIVLTVPEITDRYYTMELFCMDSDNFAYVGTRATGTAAGNYLIVGPHGWNGPVPDDVQDILPRSRTRIVGVMGRTKVYNGPDQDKHDEDLEIAQAIQSQYGLRPLSQWHKTSLVVEAPPTSTEYPGYSWPWNPATNTAAAFERMNWAMTHNPPGLAPGIDQSELIALYATIGVGPNQDLSKQSSAIQSGLIRAAETGLNILNQFNFNPTNLVKGWSYPSRDAGRAGQNSDFLTRAAFQSLGGICANDCIEAVYMNTSVDSGGDEILPTGKYKIHFDPKDFPPIDTSFNGFWSITIYGVPGYNIVGPSSNYNVNSDFEKHKDGSMTILIQPGKPADLRTGTYWLNSGAAGSGVTQLFLIMRIYMPGPEVSFTQTWQPPDIEKVG